jgi:hypothetical protein
MGVVTPLNNPGGPEGDTVTVVEKLLNTEYGAQSQPLGWWRPRGVCLVADEPASAGKELPAAAGKELLCPGLRSPGNKLQACLLVARNNGINCRAPVVVQETAARTAAAAGRMTGLPDAARSTGKGRRSRYACRGTLCALVHRAGVPSDERLFCTAGQWI